ncbi:hypothetical protein [Flavobacterium sp.]|jgi:hypothetical protein|uniref:hypothetical protein n=1 Tax=Flavobacterium sp. TaxID=239 RepID=UPI0022C79932|nr:hypothetical protein [Flavobacterium sp.]MCZ8144894.1 hypothetical protein [Flavobacterium sp.]
MKNNRKRIAQLNERRERLIQMNQAKGYTSNHKADQYLRLLLAIHKEKVGLWVFNRENNQEYMSHLNTACSMNMNLLKNLTSPKV